MKKLGLVILILVAFFGFGACGDSKDLQVESSVDLGESQTLDSNNSQVESSVDLHKSTHSASEGKYDGWDGIVCRRPRSLSRLASDGESNTDSSDNLDKSAQKDSPKDFIVTCDKCVIRVVFTKYEIDRFKKEWGEDDFYVIADDANHYAYTLDKYLEANGIKTESVLRDKVNYTKIVFSNESIDIARLDSLYEFYLYQKGKKPKKLQDTVMFEDEINAYFEITNPKDSRDWRESKLNNGAIKK